jgi:hypothetical protein
MPNDLDLVSGWPPQGQNVGSVAHVHAFGQIALTSAMLEEMMNMLLVMWLPMTQDVAVPLVYAMNNRSRADWLKALSMLKRYIPTLWIE